MIFCEHQWSIGQKEKGINIDYIQVNDTKVELHQYINKYWGGGLRIEELRLNPR